MAEYSRSKEYRKKSDFQGIKDHRKPLLLSKFEGRERKTILTPTTKSPTILIKTRDGARSASPASSIKKDAEPAQPVYQLQAKPSVTETTPVPEMTTPLKLIDCETLSLLDTCSEFLSNGSDFLVVSCIGGQGVGKSTILSHLADPKLINQGKSLFPFETSEDIEASLNKTDGIDIYITKNRIIYLDAQPAMSSSIAVKLLQQQDSLQSNKKIIPNDLGMLDMNHFEIQTYQLTTFLFSVSHLVIFVQDYFFDPDLVRFLQTAEMLKPSTATTGADETIIEYFPHLLFLQNKCQPADFDPKQIKQMQEVYNQAFYHSRLQIQTGFGIANGDVDPSLNSDTCGELINLFLLPDFDYLESPFYKGHNGYANLIEHLRKQILGTPKNPLTRTPLTEKNWFHYASKVWEGIKKSAFFNEYYRLLNNF